MADKQKLALLRDRLYINNALVTQEHLDEYTVSWQEVTIEKMAGEPVQCVNCKFWQKAWKDARGKTQYCHKTINPASGELYTDEDSCKLFEHREVKHVETVTIESFEKRDKFTVFARGDLGKAQRVFHDFEFVDERVAPPLEYPLKFTGKLRDYQVLPVAEWLKHGYGILKGATACGKSVMLAAVIAELGVRTLLLSHEVRHLKVLEERLREHTNINLLEQEYGETILGYFGGGYGPYPITLSTYQAWYSDRGQEELAKHKNWFGYVHGDEIHHVGAMTYHYIFSSFNSFYRGGTTATDTRKDKLHHAVYNSVGPVVTTAKREMLACEVTWIRTGVVVPHSLFRYSKYGFSKMQKWLAANEEYLGLQLELIVQDLAAGYKVLVIHERRAAIWWLHANLIAAGYNIEVVVGGTYQASFDEISKRLEDGVLHGIIGTKVMNENVDIPPLDCLHLPAPSTNEEMEEQRAGRIRRPWPSYENNTKKPVIRAYCFEGAKAAIVPEYVRRRVYIRLGFVNPSQQIKETKTVPLSKMMK